MQLDLLPVDSLLQQQVVTRQLGHALLQLLVAILQLRHSMLQMVEVVLQNLQNQTQMQAEGPVFALIMQRLLLVSQQADKEVHHPN